VRKGHMHWAVPYDVVDQAGNAARTVWRDVMVEEVNLNEVEQTVRNEVMKHQEEVIRKAVDRAVAEDRAKRDRAKDDSSTKGADKTCPKCPPCICPKSVDPAACEDVCAARSQTCTIHEGKYTFRLLNWLLGYFSIRVIEVGLAIGVVCLILFLLAIQQSRRGPQEISRTVGEVKYYQNGQLVGESYGTATPGLPRSPLPTVPAKDRAFYFSSPGANVTPRPSPYSNGAIQENHLPSFEYADLATSIYEDQPIITPSRTGDGVRRRSPYRQ
jgi:hypothetical protein